MLHRDLINSILASETNPSETWEPTANIGAGLFRLNAAQREATGGRYAIIWLRGNYLSGYCIY